MNCQKVTKYQNIPFTDKNHVINFLVNVGDPDTR